MEFHEAFFILVLAPEFYLPLRMLGVRFHAGMAGTTAAKRIYEILDTPLPASRGQLAGSSERTSDAVESIVLENVSYTYPNADGEPTPMPLALRIYDRVWIHLGDVVGGFCSHGCINLPLGSAVRLFNWADIGTAVLIVETLPDLDRTLKLRPAPQPPRPSPTSTFTSQQSER